MPSNDEAVLAIINKYPHVVAWALPSPSRHTQWEAWTLWVDGCDDEGNFLGWCPLHDQARSVEGSAEFNFYKGIMRCQGDPSCHAGKRAIALNNVVARMRADADGPGEDPQAMAVRTPQ